MAEVKLSSSIKVNAVHHIQAAVFIQNSKPNE